MMTHCEAANIGRNGKTVQENYDKQHFFLSHLKLSERYSLLLPKQAVYKNYSQTDCVYIYNKANAVWNTGNYK